MKCIICKKSDDNPIDYGDFLKKSNIEVHYYCLLLSTDLPQNGKDAAGFLGFQLVDVKKMAEIVSKKKCCYCKDKGASIRCNVCDASFHLVCGTRENCVFEFYGTFQSFCHEHIPLFYRKLKSKIHTETEECWICTEPMGAYNMVTSIAGKCCGYGWAHRTCMRKYALSASYYLRCIWCRKDTFRELIRSQGVFVPDREASWENKQEYRDLHQRAAKCVAEPCKCLKKYITTKMFICIFCGGNGIHEKCWENKGDQEHFTCDACKMISSLNATLSRHTVNHNGDNLDTSLFVVKSCVDRDDELLEKVTKPLPSTSSRSPVQDPTTQTEEPVSILRPYYITTPTAGLVGRVWAFEKDPTVDHGKDLQLQHLNVVYEDHDRMLAIVKKCIMEVLGPEVLAPKETPVMAMGPKGTPVVAMGPQETPVVAIDNTKPQTSSTKNPIIEIDDDSHDESVDELLRKME